MLTPHPTWEIVDSSKLSTFIECPRKYFYEYLLGWRSTTPRQDLVFGEAVHAGLEILYAHGFDQLPLACLVLEDTYRKTFDAMTDDMYAPKTVANAQEALEEYVSYYKNDMRDYEVLHTEVSGKTSLADGMDLHFRLDAVLREKSSGQVFVLEHKTTGRGGATWYAQWPLSLQVGTYTHALYGLWDQSSVYGVRVNGLCFLKKGTTFMRAPCAKTPAQMDVWHTTALHWYEKLLRDMQRLCGKDHTDWPTLPLFPLNPGSCTRWGTCPYHDFCCTWGNPLQHCAEPPIGFAIDYWDPTKHYSERKEATKHEETKIPGLF